MASRPGPPPGAKLASAAILAVVLVAGCGQSRHPAAAPTTGGPGLTATGATSTAAATSTTSASPSTTTTTSTTSTTSTTATTTTTAPAALPLAGKVVAIDPGHNGGNFTHTAEINQLVNVLTEQKACDTTGAVGADGYTESAFNFDVATRTAAILRAEGATVVLTRTTDDGVGPCVTQRAAIGNAANANAAVSIHADGGPVSGRGFQILEPGMLPDGYNDAILAPSQKLGADLQATFPAATGMPPSTYYGTDGIGLRTDLGGLNLSLVPKVFVECGNMQNPTDLALLENPGWRQEAAQGIASGITDFLEGRAPEVNP